MQENKSGRLAYLFRNTCNTCFNDTDIVLLGPFAEGEKEVQSADGKDFYIVRLAGHPAADYVSERLARKNEDTPENRYQLLVALADASMGVLSTIFPRCTHCNHPLSNYHDNQRREATKVEYLTWMEFNGLDKIEKERCLVLAYRTLGST